MKRLTPLLGHVHFHAQWMSRRAWPYVAGITIFLALVGGILRFWLPSVEEYRPEIERWLNATLKHPVSIGSLSSGWRAWAPELVVREVDLLDPMRGEPLIHFDEASIRLNIWSSLLKLRPVPSRLSASGAQFAFVRDSTGRIRIRGVRYTGALNLTDLFFAEGGMHLRGAKVMWEDEAMGTPPVQLRDVAVSLRNAGNQHQLDGEATLPGPEGQRIRFALNMTGDPKGREWDADIYLRTRALPLRSLPLSDLHRELSVTEGKADIEFWSTWRAARLVTAETRFNLAALQASLAQEPVPLRKARGVVSYRREGKSWQLAVDDLQLTTDSGRWQESGMVVTVSETETERIIGGRLPFLELDDILPTVISVAPLDTDVKEWLTASRPSGQVRDMVFIYRPNQPPEHRLLLKARLDAVDFHPHEEQPGFQGLSGSLQVQNSKGRFELDSYALVAHFPKLFTKPLEADTALGELSWQRTDEGWQLIVESLELSNLDIRLRLAGALAWAEDDPSPFLDILAHVDEGHVEAMPDYLPVHVMPRRMSAWLLKALPSGQLESGGLLLRGRARDFPFDQSEGRFEVRANLIDAILEYAPGWPRIEELDAELVLSGRSLSINVPKGKVFEADMAEARARIPDVTSKRPMLLMRGRVQSSSSDGLRFLLESPLEDKFRSALGDATVTGDVLIGLDLGIALSRKDTHRVHGNITFSGSDVDVRSADLEMENLVGTLYFDQGSLTGEGLNARIHDIPITLRVEDIDTPQLTGTRFVAEGRIDAAQILGLFSGEQSGARQARRALGRRVHGETDFRVSLDVPKDIGKEGASSTLLLRSDLRGIALDFPRPLGKKASEARQLILGATGGRGKGEVIRIGYGDDLKAILAVRRANREAELTRGAVYLGQARGDLPSTDGLHIVADVERFSSTEWLDVLYPAEEETGVDTSSAPSPDWTPFLQRIDVKARHFELIGQWTEELRMAASRSWEGGWSASIEGSTLSGTLHIPGEASDGPITMAFDRLSVRTPDSDAPTTEGQDPRVFPPLDFKCQDFNFSGIPLGRLTVVTRPHAGGLRIDRLSMEGDGFQIEATGDWWFSQGEHVSRFKIHVTSPDQGSLLRTFGYDGVVLEGGAAEVKIDANWKGSPGEFSLKRINGLLTYTATDGRLVELEPGQAGRVFGLLSFQALPRRLKLDFSDAFEKGFSYDRVHGSFTVYEGDAYTNDLYMQAPAARIDIAGRVGLANQDYDQLITVTPDVTSTFAIGGAIAGGPIGAFAAIIAQQLLKGQIDQTIERQYSISGSWDDPVIVRLQKPIVDSGYPQTEG